MPANRLPMQMIKRILEPRFTADLSVRAIASGVGVGRSSVSRLLDRAKVAKPTWPLPDGISDVDLKQILYPSMIQSSSA